MNAPFPPLQAVALEAAARLNLTHGRDGTWRGHCPSCGYSKPSLSIRIVRQHIAVACFACGESDDIAGIAGVPRELVLPREAPALRTERALNLWHKAKPAGGTPVETYLAGRGITCPLGHSLRHLALLRNWADGKFYGAMIGLVERVPIEGEHSQDHLLAAGVHLTFLHGPSRSGKVAKADTDFNRLTRGQLKHGGVWLTPYLDIRAELAVAEGIETALSVQQITGIPTVAALNAEGVRTFRWPPSIRRLWVAADNDQVGLRAAHELAARAHGAGIDVQIKTPPRGLNDFNDYLLETRK